MRSRWMPLLALLVVVIVAPRSAHADDYLPSADVLAKLRVFVDGKGRVLAHLRDYKKPPPDEGVYDFTYFGDKKTLYAIDGQVVGDSYGISDPRVLTTFRFTKDTAVLQCNETDSGTFRELSAAESRKLLAAATFKGAFWNHAPYLFARDDGTTYVFVDRPRTPDTKEFRIFVGKRGAMKEQKILDLATDDIGDVLITPAGTLRTTVGNTRSLRFRSVESASWSPAKRKQREPMIMLPLTSKLIHGDLGVYTGQRLGLPCD